MTIPANAIAEDRFTAHPRAHVPQRQRGAYGLVRDGSGQVLVVQAENGRCYLPGGRIEAGETPAAALAREIGEECGWAAEVAAPICEHDQPIFGGAVTVAASYWEARLTRPLACIAEHQVRWLEPADALSRLHRASDRDVVRRACL